MHQRLLCLQRGTPRGAECGRKLLSSLKQCMPTEVETNECSAPVRVCQGPLGTGFSRQICFGRLLRHDGKQSDKEPGIMDQQQASICPSISMYRSLFMACAKRKNFVQFMNALVNHRPESIRIAGDYALKALVRYGAFEEALDLFHSILPRSNVSSWTTLISGYVNAAKPREALALYLWMQEEDVHPNASTFVSLLKACALIADLEQGKRIHAEVLNYSFQDDLYVCTCLVTMYGKCGSSADARKVFDGVPQRDVIVWNAMLSAYAEQKQEHSALELYGKMLGSGVSPDVCTSLSVLQICGVLADKDDGVVLDGGLSTKAKSLQRGKAVHAYYAQIKGHDVHVSVGNTLISVYRKCGSIVDAQIVFDCLSERTVVSWNVMIAAYAQQGHAVAALHLYEQMVDEQVIPNDRTFVSVLQACGMLAEKEPEKMKVEGQLVKAKSAEIGKAVHAYAHSTGCALDVFVASTLVSMYAKCGSISDACHVFEESRRWRNVVLWNAMLTAYAQQGLADLVLQLYAHMCEEGVSPDARTIVSVVQGCGILAGKQVTAGNGCRLVVLQMGKVLHAYSWTKGYNSAAFVGNGLVSMYSRCGSVVDARNVFDGLDQRSVVAWTAMISGHVEQVEPQEALLLYEQMRIEGVSPDDCTFVSILQACVLLAQVEEPLAVAGQPVKTRPLTMGKILHADARRCLYELNTFVGSILVSLYGKCGSSADALAVFNTLHCLDVVLWNAMLQVYVEQGQADMALQLFAQMEEGGISPDVHTFVAVLQACCVLGDREPNGDLSTFRGSVLGKGKAVHANVVRRGYGSNVLLGNVLISMYDRCGSLSDAHRTFDQLPDRDVVTWSAMLTALSHQGQGKAAVQLYQEMQEAGVSPNRWTFVSVLQACGMLAEMESFADSQPSKQRWLEFGRSIHADVLKKGLESDVFIGNSLVSMYRKCDSLTDVQNVFDRLTYPDAMSWNALLAAHVEHGQAENTLKLYDQMLEAGVRPNARTFVSALQACGMLAGQEEDPRFGAGGMKVKAFGLGRELHHEIRRMGYGSDVFVGSSLINMYGKSGSTQDALNVFEGLSDRDVPAWNAMLAVYIEQDCAESAWQLYTRMENEGILPDDTTFVCILQMCSSQGSLAILRQVHHTVFSTRKELSPFLASALISAYGRCASMKEAQSVIDSVPETNIVSWNALIAGYARQGNWTASFQVLDRMLLAGDSPNRVTFLSLLAACSHAGLVERGLQCFESMNLDHGIIPDIEHYVTLVDLLGRAGYFTRVVQLVSTLPVKPNLALWLCLLAACRMHGKVTLGRWAFDCAVHLQPNYAAAYVLMLNIYTDAGLWDRAKEVKMLRHKAGGWKKPGQSWVETELKVHDFVVKDRGHIDQEQTYELIRKLRELDSLPTNHCCAQ